MVSSIFLHCNTSNVVYKLKTLDGKAKMSGHNEFAPACITKVAKPGNFTICLASESVCCYLYDLNKFLRLTFGSTFLYM